MVKTVLNRAFKVFFESFKNDGSLSLRQGLQLVAIHGNESLFVDLDVLCLGPIQVKKAQILLLEILQIGRRDLHAGKNHAQNELFDVFLAVVFFVIVSLLVDNTDRRDSVIHDKWRGIRAHCVAWRSSNRRW